MCMSGKKYSTNVKLLKFKMNYPFPIPFPRGDQFEQIGVFWTFLYIVIGEYAGWVPPAL